MIWGSPYCTALQSVGEDVTQELDRIEAEARLGIDILRLLLVRFPNNARLTGLFATLK